MNKDQSLKENVFDALLKTAFEEYSRAELDKLPSDAELRAMYPPQRELPKKLRRLEKRYARREPAVLFYFKRVCVILLVTLVAGTAILSTQPSVRAAITNTVVNWFEKYVEIIFVDNSLEGETELETFKTEKLQVGYIPEGYELTDEEDDTFINYKVYYNGSNSLCIDLYESDGTAPGYDTEHFECEEGYINGLRAYYFKGIDHFYNMIIFGNSEYFVSIAGELEFDEMVKVAENIK